ncbi:MAG TPA: hypothetical protein VM030_11920 [Acidimicrobiales bacterium]|nr:hypothetical protein [Acidimicrobiales bacterium]
MSDRVRVSVDGTDVRVGWGEPDWLGPLRFVGRHVGNDVVRAGAERNGSDRLGEFDIQSFETGPVTGSVRSYPGRRLAVLRIEATADLGAAGTGSFAVPSVAWSISPTERIDGGVPDGTVGFGFQYTEFAMPTLTDASLQGWFLFPARPSLVLPMMLIAPDGRTLLLAPLDNFHEQILAVDGGLRWGWHGDLGTVEAGFATELAIWGADGPRAALDEWGAELVARHGTMRPGRYADDLNRRPSYWTDNGAAYWYRTEAGHDVHDTLVATVEDLRARDVPFGTFQLDSWFYPHATLRPFDTADWVVPPSGLMEWDARADILPDGIVALRRDLGDPPLTAHCRHLSSSSPYLQEFDAWVDGERAHPTGPELYERWLDQASQWGVVTLEHDWLIECFLGVQGLRAAPGRARAWQEGVDGAAGERGMTLQWCMPSPADICQTVSLANVASIRTSGDHGYIVSPGYLWAWFLYTNAFAGALGLRPFKDVFSADPTNPEAHTDVEALLSALSTGPVGIGDRLGRADAAVVRRTCRADATLVKPDTPVAALDRSFMRWATGRRALLVGAATTDHLAGTWHYVVTLNAGEAPVTGRVELSDLGRRAPTGPVVVWDWRRQTAELLEPDGGWDVALDPLDWDYRVVAPLLSGGVAVIGDPGLYATAGDMRIGGVTDDERGVRATVLGAEETVELVTWSRPSGVGRQTVEVPLRGWSVTTL